MDEQRLERMEDMLSKLITMVGTLNQQQQETKNEMLSLKNEMQGLKNEMQDMKKEQQEMKNDQLIMRIENERQFTEVHKTLTDIRLDQDHIWEKVVRNERELAKLRGHLQL